MRHRKSGLKLNRTSSHRKAMFRNMVTSLLKHQRIRTTAAKAKELRSWADHLITLAKRGDLHARRQALSIVREKDIVHKLFEEAGDRNGVLTGEITSYRDPKKTYKSFKEAVLLSSLSQLHLQAGPNQLRLRQVCP